MVYSGRKRVEQILVVELAVVELEFELRGGQIESLSVEFPEEGVDEGVGEGGKGGGQIVDGDVCAVDVENGHFGGFADILLFVAEVVDEFVDVD